MSWSEDERMHEGFREETEYSCYAVKPFFELGQDPNCREQKSNASSVDLPLNRALINRKKERAKFLLESGADPNLANENGVTPLHCICDSDYDYDDDWAKMLFEISDRKLQSVKVNAVDNSGRTPLHYAVRKGWKSGIVEILLKNDADPNVADVDGSTPLHILCNRSRYWDQNDGLSELLILIKDVTHHPLQVDAQDKWGRTPLHLALIQNREKMTQFLLRQGANPNLANAKGSTPLHTICERSCDDDIMKMFFDINDERHETVQVDACDKLGNTPLHSIVSSGVLVGKRFVFLLRRGANPNAANVEGSTPLHIICKEGYLYLSETLFELTDDKYKPLQVNAQDKLGNTPLHLHLNLDLDRDHYRYTTESLLRNDADPNLANADGLTSLHIICKKKYDYDDLVKMLFELSNEKYQPLLIDAQDNLGNTPLHYAVAESFKEQTVRVLLESGANPNLVNVEGLTPLNIVCQRAKKFCGDKNDLEMFFKNSSNFRQMMQIYPQDQWRKTALHLALGLDGGFKNLVESLLQNGADPNLPNEDGLTPLHFICAKNDVLMLAESFMLNNEKLTWVEAQDRRGHTPLLYALIQDFNKGIVQVLLKNGADPNQVDVEGLTPLHVLCEDRVKEIERISKKNRRIEIRDRFFGENDDHLSDLFLMIKDGTHQPLKVDALDKYGRTPLYLALINERIKMAESLMRNGANLNLANAKGMAILPIICKRDQEGLLEKLFEICDDIQQTVQVDTPDELGRTPLQWAVANLMPNAVDMLLDHGADLSSFVFPTESYFAVELKIIYYVINFQVDIASTTVAVVERLKKRGYELHRNDVLTIMQLLVRYKLFKKSTNVEKCCCDGEKSARVAKQVMINSNVSLYELIQLRIEEAEQLLTCEDYLEFVQLQRSWSFSNILCKVCLKHLCEIIMRRFCRRWALEFFMKLTHYRISILSGEKIIKQLMNEDLCNICLATAPKGSYRQQSDARLGWLDDYIADRTIFVPHRYGPLNVNSRARFRLKSIIADE